MSDVIGKEYWLWLSMVPGVGVKRFYKLLDEFGDPKNVWNSAKLDTFRLSTLVGKNIAKSIIQHRTDEALNDAKCILNNPDMFILTVNDAKYPTLLKAIYDPPPVLYCKGNPFKQEAPSIAIVGSRRMSEYGRMVAVDLARQLAQNGVTIVSGLARGIDTMAHKGAIEGAGYTIGVLGCGVDVVYPPENKMLFVKMQKTGTIISEFPPGIQPLPRNFPMRNRIISGLSHGVLVVEAGERSGAMITVDFALEQGREVYAVPGSISSPYSRGTNRILKEGARLVTDVRDILDDLGIESFDGCPKKGKGNYQLDFLETQVYNALEEGGRRSDELARITNLDIGKLNAILTVLEIKGIVKQMPGKIFMRL